MKTQTITIIGLDRVGASVALALQASSLEVTIVGHDRDIALASQAQKAGTIDKAERNLPRAAEAADILVLTVPVIELEETLAAVGDVLQTHTLVLDLAGWKGAGLKWARTYLQQGHYVGASLVLSAAALTDSRTSSEAASADLFKDSVFCVMPSAKAEPKAVETAVNFGHLLGAVPYFVDAMEYDSLVQGLETVPGLIAAAMFSAVRKSTGWRDMLRFAGLPFAQSTQPLGDGSTVAHLAMGNKEATLRWLDVLIEELRQVRRWLLDGEEELLSALLVDLSLQREKWLHERSENNWIEIKAPDVEGPSFTQQMLGGFVSRGGDKKRDNR
jgi:prephenate dehydrogenase